MSVSDQPMCNHAYNGNIAAVKKIAQENSSAVTDCDKSQRSPLHWACASGQRDVIVFLIDQGAKVCNLTPPMCGQSLGLGPF